MPRCLRISADYDLVKHVEKRIGRNDETETGEGAPLCYTTGDQKKDDRDGISTTNSNCGCVDAANEIDQAWRKAGKPQHKKQPLADQ